MPTLHIFSNYLTFMQYRIDSRFKVGGKFIRAESTSPDPEVRHTFSRLMELAISAPDGKINVSKAIYDELYKYTRTPNIDIPDNFIGRDLDEAEQVIALRNASRTSLFSEDEIEFLTAVACDIEVELQKQRLMNCARYLGFDIHDATTDITPMNLHDVEGNFTELKAADLEILDNIKHNLVEGDISLINTHGRAQSLDGPMQNAIAINAPISRIVIDACQSAAVGFPMKKGGSRTVLQVVADEALKFNKEDTTEIVGHLNVFDSTAAQSLYAAFSKKPSEKSNNIRVLTIEARKQELAIVHNGKYADKVLAKQQLKDPIRKNMQKVISSLMAELITADNIKIKDAYARFREHEIFNILPDIKDGALAILEKEHASGQLKNIVKRTKDLLKEHRNSHIMQLGEHDLERAVSKLCKLAVNRRDDTDFNSSLDVLKDYLVKMSEERIANSLRILAHSPSSSVFTRPAASSSALAGDASRQEPTEASDGTPRSRP